MPNAHYDASDVARLERVYSTPQVVDQRRRFRAVIGACAGEVGLDIGCGAGHLACELGREVAPGGRIVAIDKSRDCVDAARTRVAREDLADTVVVQSGDAAVLAFPEESFDFVACAQVYCFVANVAGAIQEAARVLRKGGRLLVLDSDWDTCIWKCEDPRLTRRMVSARAARFAHAHLPRDLHKLFRAAGLTLADARTIPIVETRHDPGSYGTSAIEVTCDEARKQGVPAADIAAWEKDLRSRTADGEWFFCLDRFVFTGRK